MSLPFSASGSSNNRKRPRAQSKDEGEGSGGPDPGDPEIRPPSAPAHRVRSYGQKFSAR